MSIPSELGHLAMPTNFLANRKNQMAQASFEPGTFRSRVLRSARCATLARQCGAETKKIGRKQENTEKFLFKRILPNLIRIAFGEDVCVKC